MNYWKIDAFCFTLGFTFCLLSLYEINLEFFICSVIWIWVYPIVLQATLNMYARGEFYSLLVPQAISRIVYHPNYNINLWGLEKKHPFDSQKYARVYDQIVERGLIREGYELRPQEISRSFLIQKMNPMYLLKLCYGYQVSRLIEVPFWWLPGWVYRWKILSPMLRAVEGSVLASYLALQLGWAVNLSGGFHHASYDRGGGFCIYPDISLIVYYLQSRLGLKRFLIIDLDAHQGNGYQRDLVANEDVYIVDCYNSRIFPQDIESKDAIKRRLQIQTSITNEDYLKLLDSLEKDFEFGCPEFVIYNAGTDVLAGDPLGELNISKQTVIKRDEKVIGMCRSHGVPVVMLLSGGYQQMSAEVIADSLQNLFEKFG